MIKPKGLKVSGFDGSHLGVVIRKFSEGQSKILTMGVFSPKCPNWVITLCLSKPPHLLQTAIALTHIGQQNCAQTTFCSFSSLLFEPCGPN